jgi:autotransporter translocation and assembly factor TamB
MRRSVVIAGSAVLALVLLVAAAVAFHNPLVALVVRSIASGAGYRVTFGRLEAGLTEAVATGTTVTNRAGEPVFSADRIELHYSIKNVLPGSNRRRFGISALDIARPVVTLIHHADGTYNVTLPAGGAPAKPDTTPIDLQVRVRDGSAVLLDRYIVPGQERRQRIVGLAADAALVPHAHSYYTVRFDLDDGRTLHPVTGRATFAADRGFEAQRWRAADVPIGPLIDFALPSHAIDIVDGDLRNIDGRVYTFVDPDGTAHTHLALRADLTRGKVYVAGILKPLRDAHGTFIAYDNGMTTTGVDATLAGVPLHLAGGVYDLAAPKLHLALTGRGELAQLQQAIAPAQRQPLSGDLSFAIRALGGVSAPTISGSFFAPQMVYRGFPLEQPGGTFSLHGQNLDLLGAHLQYGPIRVEAHGSLALAKAVGVNLVIAVDGAGDQLPYVPQLVRGLRLTSVVHVEGVGTKLASTGVLYGDAPGGGLDALFDVDANGNGVIGPLSIQRSDGASIYARVALDRPRGTALGIGDAQHFSLLPAALAPLPGLHVAALPVVAGTLDAQLAGGLDGDQLDALSGHVRLSGLRFGAITGSAALDLATAGDGTQRGRVNVASSLGTIDGNAGYANGLVAFDGRLRSSFAQLAPLTGNLGASGIIDGALLALSDGSTFAVQTPELRFNGARIHGVPLGAAHATATLQNGALDVRALQLGLAGGTVTVRGRLGGGTANELVATTSPLDLRSLAAGGAALSGGTLLANARVHGSLTAPQATIGVLIDRARRQDVTLSANAFAEYANGTLHIADATALAFDSYATAAGDVRDLTAGTPSIDLSVNLRGAQLAPIAAALKLPLRYPEGELDADLHASGPATSPQVAGTVRIPNGSLNGLNFSDAGVAISGGTGGITARNGSVRIGTTAISFSGAGGPSAQQITLSAPHVDLADFDDYFDAADTLAGTGHAVASASLTHTSVRAAGDLLIRDARYKRYSIGDLAANVNTAGRTVHANASIRSDHGTALLTSEVTLPASDPLRDPTRRALLAANGSIAGFDLAQWLPAAGLRLPVTGIADATARLTGTLAAPAFAVSAGVTNGIVAGYALATATLAASGDARSAHLEQANVAGPGLSATASGTFGYGAHDPIAIALHVQSDDIALLAKSLGAKIDAAGAFTTTLAAAGTRAAPRLTQTLDVTNLTSDHYTVPRIHAELAADPNTLRILAFEADLQKGRLSADAVLPIRLTAPIGVRDDPFSADLHADDIELAQFAALLPENSKLTGRIDGNVGVRGTPQAPAVTGTLALAGGGYSSRLVRSGFTNARARLDFTQTQARLSDLHTDVGGGAFDGAANATFGDLRDLDRTLAVNGSITAKNAAINIANLFRGTIDGTLDLSKAQGAIPTLGGTLAFTKTRIPLAALIPKASGPSTTEVPRTVNFALNVQAGTDVRVQGPGVDIGARGAVAVGGNLAKPELNGQITSTNGTLSFYRTFVLQSGTVSFHPEDGLIPDVDATATTTISNPSADILLHVTGPATNLNLDLASNPSYDKEQILGLLVGAQAFGAVPGVETAQSTGPGISAGSIAGGFLGNELTQNLLQPVGSQLGQSLGFQDLALGYDFGSGVSAGARKQLGKNLYATFNQTFGADDRQTIALNYTLPHNATVALTVFNAGDQAPSLLTTQQLFSPTVQSTNYTLEALQPPPGISGVVLTYQRKY